MFCWETLVPGIQSQVSGNITHNHILSTPANGKNLHGLELFWVVQQTFNKSGIWEIWRVG